MLVNPFSLWLDMVRTGMDIAQTISGTQNVVMARLPVIAAAFHSPLTADHRELSLMVSEKVDAFGKASVARARDDASIRDAWSANARDMGRLAGGAMLGPQDWLAIMNRNTAAMTSWFAIPAKVLAPYHKAVTANDRRLARRGRRM
ncbi:hypothetical protein [Sphingobium sp. SYK-6]|uniref:hypothetical protein n=1 Tax=Sphingobium sp. (strain NBRC 103272 / SYK-6) TaxID=627192 RepID=UPI0002E84C6D|nr:hypothetical protein [Sphingobium sp. SYK-6]